MPNKENDKILKVSTNQPKQLLEQVAAILADENLKYEWSAEHTVLNTGFINQSISFFIQDNHLIALTRWRGQPSADTAADIMTQIAQWNTTQLAPSVSFSESNTGLILLAQRSLWIGNGISINQLGAFSLLALESFIALWNRWEINVPELITWETDNA
ncbi:Uncharacterised protein [Corynebacterium kutscheri]|uniref:Bacterial sensory transduction regulator n=1 Tax=Corynebacterium kutscheri TaxID=35755 RepID=A0A0F6TDW2_9CORY|nr:YbjN domain-containing protein [Corynebacterium kutscheri]AKE41311.1 hypothetical protein UL82_05680 [Corynebacterium kutscheri]VEH08587.1 Uncharacterised protein [Corynebacterium kutscheri]VEH09633.1 Uncharacterised protein [Corynebacterium kutscheri]VEH79716.1 Uncharacterised protein [Corynebacterium kutscheri]